MSNGGSKIDGGWHRIDQDPELAAFLKAQLKTAWTGSTFVTGSQTRIYREALARFGPARVPPRTTFFDHLDRVRKEWRKRTRAARRRGRRVAHLELLVEINRQLAELIAELRVARGASEESVQTVPDKPLRGNPQEPV